MPIGDDFRFLYKKDKLKYLFFYLFGIYYDLHSKIRLKPLYNFLKNYLLKNKKYRILELGCGNVINAFEINKIINNFEYDGFDLNCENIEQAKKLIEIKNLNKKIRLFNKDINKYNFKNTKKYDMVLLIDILEHLKNPEFILKKISEIIKKDSIILVSVPTYNYKRFFGEKFHKLVGHVREGFSLNELNNLFSLFKYDLIYYQFNTGIISRELCSFFYKYDFKNSAINTLKRLLLQFSDLVDFINNEKVSCSLFAVYKKVKK
ncbi:MAG: class I SAM-dependent methyltransferase [Candidatus Goldbacteria bacterium]|nr:class I SAM-dependent methyltransferase [Candidatus Goldiibacteriota bacterium]